MDTERGGDVLSHVLATYKSERAVTARFSLSAPWALHSTGVAGPLIRMCTGAPYWIAVDGAEPVQVAPHDIAMLPQGGAHTVSSVPGLDAMPFRELIEAHSIGRHGDHPIVFSHGGGGPVTELFSLHLWMPAQGLGSIIGSLPSLIVLRQAQIPTTASLAQAMESLVNETVAQRPGWQLSAARMADLLLVHILCEHLYAQPQAQSQTGQVGRLRGLDDESIARAMSLMHERPEHPWSVATLAQASYLSRTIFSERFRALVGVTPMHYLGSYRMTLAAEKLKNRQLSLHQVAEAVGYASEKAFSRAFQRWTGMTPSAYARQQGGPESD
ncbi:AraC family transcriptional regulator [Variovorax paradoxus]|jgi:AraC-like DNA-binding protein|uniref:AraC family transcriptional regulator n=1 Tax=Variovorax paradoxus TaxID=34073 RepID=UPI00339B3DD0